MLIGVGLRACIHRESMRAVCERLRLYCVSQKKTKRYFREWKFSALCSLSESTDLTKSRWYGQCVLSQNQSFSFAKVRNGRCGQVVSSEKQHDEWNYELHLSEETGHRMHKRQT